MKLLITLHNPISLVIHETLSLAFALASFGHEIQLQLGDDVADFLLNNIDNPLAKMFSSLDMYDIPPAWITNNIADKLLQHPSHFPENFAKQLLPYPATIDSSQFDSVFNF